MRNLIARNVGYSTNTENPLGPVEVVYLIEEPARAELPKKPLWVRALEVVAIAYAAGFFPYLIVQATRQALGLL